jgi:hypothetical protein
VRVSDFGVRPSTALAGANPRLTVGASFAYASPGDTVRDVILRFPPGVAFDPLARERCTQAQLDLDGCPAASLIGSITLRLGGLPGTDILTGDLFGLEPAGSALSRVAVVVPTSDDLAHPIRIEAPVVLERRADGYAFELTIPGMPARVQGTGDVTDAIRVDRLELALRGDALVRNPTGCRRRAAAVSANSYIEPEGFGDATAAFAATGCSRLGFAPAIGGSVGARGRHRAGAHAPLRLSVQLRRPDAGLRSGRIQLPERVRAVAQPGTRGCSQVDLAADRCAPAAVVGSVTARSPLVARPATGSILLASGAPGGLPRLLVRLRGALPFEFPVRIERSGGRAVLVLGEVPDLPLSSLSLSLDGDLFRATGRLCTRAGSLAAGGALRAHSGARARVSGALTVPGCRRR